jgi:NADPH:quinone reductase
MKVVEITSFGPPGVLKIAERPKPAPAADEVLIQIAAAGVARADLMQREGHYPPPPGASDIPGLDVAGIIDSVGENVAGFRVGDPVCAILTGGGYAEFCTAPVSQVLPKPKNWTLVETATLPENLFTVYDNLITRADLKAGERVLIHGGASGIGTIAIMLARAWGAEVIATAGTAEKCRACLDLGAVAAINYKESDFVAESKKLTQNRGVDVVLDLVGGPYLARNLEALAAEGRLSIVSIQGGRKADIDLGVVMQKRLRVIGSTMRARTPQQKGEIAKRLLQEVWPLLPGRKMIRPIIDKTFLLSEASLAHERLSGGQHIGKILLLNS